MGNIKIGADILKIRIDLYKIVYLLLSIF